MNKNAKTRIITRNIARPLNDAEVKQIGGSEKMGPYISDPKGDMCGGY